jgi:hypothetical protein
LKEAYGNLPVEGKVTFLLTTICNGTQAEEMRAMAAVLLRRLFSSEFMDFYPKVTIKISYCHNIKIRPFEPWNVLDNNLDS